MDNNTVYINEFVNDSIELLNDYQEMANNFKTIVFKAILSSNADTNLHDLSDFYNNSIIPDLTKYSNVFEIKPFKIACDNDKKLLKRVTKLKNYADKLIKKFKTLEKKYKFMLADFYAA